MPNPPKPQSAPKARMPKAEILWTSTEDLKLDKLSSHKWSDADFPVAVLPFPTAKAAKAAKAFVRFVNMDRKKLLRLISRKMWTCREEAKEGEHTIATILSALSFPQAGGGK